MPFSVIRSAPRHWLGLCALILFLGGSNWLLGADLPAQYLIRRWQTEQGLPQNSVTAIVQTRDGYLWFGTYAGLVRFDGVRFQVFDADTTPELVNSRVTSLFEGADGTLWIGHETGNLTRLQHGRFQAVPVPKVVSDDGTLIISADEHGDVWLMNYGGVLARLRDGLVISSGDETLKQWGSACLAQSQDGRLWVARWGSLGFIEHDQMVRVQPESNETNRILTQAIAASLDGGMWVICDYRLRKLKAGRWTDEIPNHSGVAFDSAMSLLETKSGQIVVGSERYGLILFSPQGSSAVYNATNGLPVNWVRCFCEDHEGNLWIGTGGSGGLTQMRMAAFDQLTPPDHWRGSAVLSTTLEAGGALWVGTEGSGLYRFDQGAWTRFGDEAGLTAKYVWSVCAGAEPQLWVGAWDNGVFAGVSNRFEKLAGFQTELNVSALLPGQHGDLWIGTRAGLLHREAGGQVTAFGRNEGLTLPDVRTVLEEPDGTVWFGMAGGGLGRLRGGVLKQFRKADGLASDFVLCLRREPDGALWIGTFGGGLNRLKDGRFARISTREGLLNNSICDIQMDSSGNWWMSSQGGVMRVARSELERCADGLLAKVGCVLYGIEDGLPTAECSGGFQPAGTQGADGRIYFPTSRGLLAVNPAGVKSNPQPPPVVIEELLANGHQLLTNTADPAAGDAGPLRIPPGNQRFEFRYTALSFSVPGKVRFKYRLEGLETEWVEATGQRSATYSHLPPGSYVFHVLACNNDGVWNEAGAKLGIVILPAFWQTWWFRLAGYLAAGGTVAFIVGWIVRKRHQRKIERLERLRAIERERTRIAKDIHDDMGASLTRIMMLSQPDAEAVQQPRQFQGQLDRIYDTAHALTTAIDEIVWAVNPAHDTFDSLASYVAEFAQEFLAAAGIRCRFEIPPQLPAWPLSAESRHNLFLACKEALNNIARHAQATEVCLAITASETVCTLSIEDNGRGFAVEQFFTATPGGGSPALSNGLTNMRRRLEQIGGEFTVDSRPGHGTRLRFIVRSTLRTPVPPGSKP
jgi:signal transduction histidine kinase/ligand-binding sensor domain-containing protein